MSSVRLSDLSSNAITGATKFAVAQARVVHSMNIVRRLFRILGAFGCFSV